VKKPTAEVLDSRGRVVKHFGSKDVTGKAGFNRFTWDTTEDKPEDWNFTPSWNKGFESGVPVLPGTYTVLVHAGSETLREHVTVQQDPRMRYTPAELRSTQEAERSVVSDFDRVDKALNMLSTVLNEAPLRAGALNASGQRVLATRVSDVAAQAKSLLLTITQNPANDQDNDFLTDILRERLQTQLFTFGSYAPLTQTQLQENAVLHALTNDRMRAVRAFAAGPLSSVESQLRAQKLPPLTTLTKKPDLPDSAAGERRGDQSD
jgi:hypothetical protein